MSQLVNIGLLMILNWRVISCLTLQVNHQFVYDFMPGFVCYQITSDFVAAATRGAVAVVDGNVMAINPGEDEK